jgi:hypothetical protein
MVTLLCLLACFDGPAQTYGAGVKESTPLVSIETLMADPEAWLGKVVKVEGKVKAVCEMKGCWLDVSASGKHVRVKVKDGEIVFAPELVGQKVVAEGTVYKFDLDQEQAVSYFRHLAEEKGESFDPASVTSGTTIYQLGGIGLEVLAAAEPD